MRHRKVTRDPLRALTSEMLPYEVPLPVNTSMFYAFLRRIKFSWIEENKFKVLAKRFGKAEKHWLEIIFDCVDLPEGVPGSGYLVFDLKSIQGSSWDLRHPYKYRAKRSNGKNRGLALPHPQSMLTMAHFISDYRDSILYYTNRSSYSIRHPFRAARLRVKRDAEFAHLRDRESYGFEQYDLEYEHATSFFAYRRYNNINRFYESS